MLNDKNIALFIDADNCNLDFCRYDNAVTACKKAGNIIYGKIYGLSDRKHKEIINSANDNGFDTANVMRVKKRGSNTYDDRITVDVLDTVMSYDAVDAVCIVAAPHDMVYLFSKLHALGVSVMAVDTFDEQSLAFADEVFSIGAETPKPVKKSASKPKKAEQNSEETEPEEQPQPAEIADFKQEQPSVAVAETPQDEQPALSESEEKAEQPPQDEQPAPDTNEDEPQLEPQPQAENKSEETQPEQENASEQDVDQPTVEITNEPDVEQAAEQKPVATPVEDTELLRQIEQVKAAQSQDEQEDGRLLAEIKRLLDDFNTENN